MTKKVHQTDVEARKYTYTPCLRWQLMLLLLKKKKLDQAYNFQNIMNELTPQRHSGSAKAGSLVGTRLMIGCTKRRFSDFGAAEVNISLTPRYLTKCHGLPTCFNTYLFLSQAIKKNKGNFTRSLQLLVFLRKNICCQKPNNAYS